MKLNAGILAASTLALALPLTALPAQAAQAEAKPNRSLAKVLTSDGNTFDRNAGDFDILTEAVLAVVAAKPDSPVTVLTKGKTRLTAFAPTDQAFRLLAKDLTGKTIKSEKKIFTTLVAAAGVDTIEQVLLYHVVPGKTLKSGKVLKSNNKRLKTASGKHVRVIVQKHGHRTAIVIRDKDRNDRNARVILKKVDINKGNKQIAHAVDRVLRPINL